MQGQWYFLYHSKTNAFWMCDTDVARIGDLRCRQCNAITEDNGLLFFGPCTSHRQHHLEYSLRNHKRGGGSASKENCAHKVRKIKHTSCIYFLPFSPGRGCMAISVSAGAARSSANWNPILSQFSETRIKGVGSAWKR